MEKLREIIKNRDGPGYTVSFAGIQLYQGLTYRDCLDWCKRNPRYSGVIHYKTLFQ